MKLSIIVPVLNEGEALARRLRALQPLRQRGAQLIVVDGGSQDSTWAVASSQADKVLLAPRGRASQMNAGAAHSNSDVLLFLHADTELPPHADELIAAALNDSKVHWGRFDVRIDSALPTLRWVETLMNLRSRLTSIATGDQAMFVRREAFASQGGFTDIALMEDIDLSRRLKKLGPPACLRERVSTSGRRWERQGVWRTIALMWRLRAAYFLGADPALLALRYGYAPRPAAAPSFAVAVLAKAPLAGLAKTRLIPLLGPAGAARAQRRFCLQTLHTARAALPQTLTLQGAPDSHQRFFRALHQRHGLRCEDQVDGDLGQRMAAVFAAHFASTPELPLLLVGTDCPVLSPTHLHQASAALEQHDAVLIPAEDGGYVLIGLRRYLPTVFEGITWSTPQVLAQTRERLRAAGASWTELAPLWDVDEPADWQRLQKLEQGSE